MDVAMEVLEECLQQALALIRRAAEEDGLDLSDLAAQAEPAILSLYQERLRQLATEYARLVCEVEQRLEASIPDGIRSPDAEEGACAGFMLEDCMTLAAKIGRISCYLTPEGEPEAEDTWFADGVPNLLLIQRLDREVARQMASLAHALPELASPRFRKVRGDLLRALRPLFATIRRQDRLAIRRLKARGRAPSPFCIRVTAPTAPDRG